MSEPFINSMELFFGGLNLKVTKDDVGCVQVSCDDGLLQSPSLTPSEWCELGQFILDHLGEEQDNE